MESTNVQVLGFEGRNVRMVFISGEPWWVLKDVCKVLGIANSRDTADRLDEDEKNTVVLNDGIPGNPNKTIVNESGLYSVILRSDKPDARKFKKWVTSEVLPAIRKTGQYKTQKAKIADESRMARLSLTDQWKEHGANKPYYYVNLTRAEYKSLGYGNGVGVHKANMSKEEIARLMVLESLETYKLIRNPSIAGYHELSSSVQETGGHIGLLIDNVIAARQIEAPTV